MPLNVYNLVLDVYNPFQKPEDQETMLIIYAVCHVLGMSSACANPWLYGWYNDNFRNEFRDIASPILLCFGQICPTLARQISVSTLTSTRRIQRPDESFSGVNGAGGGMLNGDDGRSQLRGNEDDSPSRLTNAIPMTSTQINPTCEVEVTLIDSSYVQGTIQTSPMLWIQVHGTMSFT